MKLTTSKNKTYNVEWIDVAVMSSGHVLLQMKDERRLPEIAAEFDGLEWMKRESDTQGDKTFEGFTKLIRISRMAGLVQLTFDKEG